MYAGRMLSTKGRPWPWLMGHNGGHNYPFRFLVIVAPSAQPHRKWRRGELGAQRSAPDESVQRRTRRERMRWRLVRMEQTEPRVLYRKLERSCQRVSDFGNSEFGYSTLQEFGGSVTLSTCRRVAPTTTTGKWLLYQRGLKGIARAWGGSEENQRKQRKDNLPGPRSHFDSQIQIAPLYPTTPISDATVLALISCYAGGSFKALKLEKCVAHEPANAPFLCKLLSASSVSNRAVGHLRSLH